jgi:hypothetical protein
MLVDDFYLNTDNLRDLAAKYESKPYWFGLGFMQLKLNDSERMHFWLPDLPAIERDEVHNHRYDFYSRVLAGMLIHETFQVNYDLNGDFELFETDCSPEKEGTDPKHLLPCFLQPTGKYTLYAGTSYTFFHDAFHTTRNTRYAVTFLSRSLKTKESALVAKPRGTKSTCPFADAKSISEKECWERIDAALLKIRASV